MSAAVMTSAIAVESKTCALAGCANTFTRDRAREDLTRWERRKYCSRVCSSTARRKPGSGASKPQHAVSAEPAPEPPRYVDGIWRPRAPGFPDTPRIPAHLRSAS